MADALNIEDLQEASNNDDIIPEGVHVVLDPEFASFGGEYLDWNNSVINFDNFLNSKMNEKAVQYSLSGSSSSLFRHSPPSTYQAVQIQEAILSP